MCALPNSAYTNSLHISNKESYNVQQFTLQQTLLLSPHFLQPHTPAEKQAGEREDTILRQILGKGKGAFIDVWHKKTFPLGL